MTTAGETIHTGQSGGAAAAPARRDVRALGLVFVDQAVISGGNFVTMLLLARWLTPATFGGFALVYAGLLFVKNLHLALVTTPLMTIGGALGGERFAEFRSAVARLHVGCTLVALALVGAGGGLLAYWNPHGPWRESVAPATIAVAGLLGQEFVRRALLAEQERGAALVNDALRYAIQLSGLIVCFHAGRLDVGSAFAIMAVAGWAAVLAGLPRMLPWRDADRGQRRRWVDESLDYGKWLAGHYAGVWVIERWYLIGLAALVSTVEAGVFVACVTLLSTMNLFYLSFENYAMPVFARRHAADGSACVRGGFARMLALGAVAMALACGLVAAFAEPLLRLCFGTQYAGYGWFLGLIALQAFIGFFARSTAIGLKILRCSREVFWAYTVAAAITVAVSGPLISRMGLAGAGVGMVLTQLALAVPLLYWLFVRPLTPLSELSHSSKLPRLPRLPRTQEVPR